MRKRERERGLYLALQCNKNSCVMWHKWLIRDDIMCSISIMALYICQGFWQSIFSEFEILLMYFQWVSVKMSRNPSATNQFYFLKISAFN